MVPPPRCQCGGVGVAAVADGMVVVAPCRRRCAGAGGIGGAVVVVLVSPLWW